MGLGALWRPRGQPLRVGLGFASGRRASPEEGDPTAFAKENGRILCEPHNDHACRLAYGDEFVERVRRRRKRRARKKAGGAHGR